MSEKCEMCSGVGTKKIYLLAWTSYPEKDIFITKEAFKTVMKRIEKEADKYGWPDIYILTTEEVKKYLEKEE